MNVLVACEESQAVCKAFRNKGHTAFSCDIQDCSGGHPEWHIKADCIPIIYDNSDFYTCDGVFHQSINFDLLIAFPPCTYLSNCGNRHLYNKDGSLNDIRYKKGLKAAEFFLMLYNAPINKICLENPIPNSIYNLSFASQTIQPFYFGHDVRKTTRLWLKNLPLLFATDLTICRDNYMPGTTKGTCISNSSVDRSKTFSGVAAAMASQWG